MHSSALCGVASSVLVIGGVACGSDAAEDADASIPADAEVDAQTSCEGADFLHAPPPSEAFGVKRVFVDVQRVEGEFLLDVATNGATARATMYFQMGDEGGNPTFDLRQTISYAELNGEEIADPNWELRFRGFDTGSLRAADAWLPACSENQLYLEYALAEPLPDVRNGTAPIWKPGAVEWGFKLYDVWPARLLEQWLPVGLMNDYIDLAVEVDIANATADHTLMTNGDAEVLAASHWRITFPSYFTSMSPFVEIVPTGDLAISVSDVALPGDASVSLEVYQHTDVSADLAELVATFEAAFVEFATNYGPYMHGDRFTAYVLSDDYQSEEYEGATTTIEAPTTMRHELLHSWYGRGVRPATFNDSWFDEAWVVYVTSPPATPLAPDDPPVVLHTSDPWLRALQVAAYSEGARMFLALENLLGAESLAGLMRDFARDNALERVTTADLERHLYCASGEAEVLFWFHRFVYGRDGDPPPPATDLCP